MAHKPFLYVFGSWIENLSHLTLYLNLILKNFTIESKKQ